MEDHYPYDGSDDELTPLLPKAGQTPQRRTSKAPSSSVAKGAKNICTRMTSALTHTRAWKALHKHPLALRSRGSSVTTQSIRKSDAREASYAAQASRDAAELAAEMRTKAVEADARHLRHALEWADVTTVWMAGPDVRSLSQGQMKLILDFAERFGDDFAVRRACRREAMGGEVSAEDYAAEQKVLDTLVALKAQLRSRMACLSVLS
ncbi:hypothetical protein BP6252_01721 [Coleophoma cylindrospora]|uniref:Uncharacterized protein n=1 Tax=Coleophoma cylindrospora TaxID=1849047 RepID=A0A3D8STR2_9HELO|nr:hypothetical protein BP6252_01721 [Coleophoma cylindrospora]